MKVVINNQYSEDKYKKDTFVESFNFTRFGVYAYKKGLKNLDIEIIEQVINLKNINKDSSSLILKNYKKYFRKEVYVK